MASNKPNPPTNVAATDGNVGSVTITWDRVITGANTIYAIYRATSRGQKGTFLGRTYDLSWIDTGATANITYWYGVTAQGARGCSQLSDQDSGYLVGDQSPPPNPAQVITLFTATPSSIVDGDTVTITWTTTNATAVKLNGVTVASSGSTTATPSATFTYVLQVSGSVADITRSTTVHVDAITPPATPQTITSFTVSPASVVSGAGTSVTLTWVTANATSVTLDGVAVATSGSTTRVPTATHSYVLSASGAVANIGAVATVTVTPAPVLIPAAPTGLTLTVLP